MLVGSMIVNIVLHAILIGTALSSPPKTENYCDPELCPQFPHIACIKNTGLECGQDVESIKFNQTHIDYILNATNTIRNEAAGGARGLPKALKMAVMKWDEELASLAAMRTKYCVANLYTCRNTRRFRFSGQNVYKLTSREIPEYTQLFDDAIKEWYNEINSTTASDIESYPRWTQGRVIGHYTQLVGERSDHIGCGLTKWRQQEVYTVLFACNFSSGNIPGYPVYRSARKAGSSCFRKDKRFTNCCDANEHINPNMILKNGQY